VSNPWTTTDEWADSPAAVLPTAAGKRVYPSLTEWVNRWLFNTYRRPTGGQHHAWCRDWWAHPEAVSRFTAMWDTWEAGGATSDWWLTADLHMDRLRDPQGPFVGCANGHLLNSPPPMAHTAPPPGWEPPPA
jgi:hypothetical protein